MKFIKIIIKYKGNLKIILKMLLQIDSYYRMESHRLIKKKYSINKIISNQ
jgi:hypothetical protein